MSETFTFDVAYSTTFEDLEKLREKMLEFVKAERRDFQPSFDVSVKGTLSSVRLTLDPIAYVLLLDFPDQEKLTLTADIKYKSNWQLGAIKGMTSFSNVYVSLLRHTHMGSYLAKRRNKWICALKTALGELKVYGPKGNPDAGPSTTRYTRVPWELVQAQDREEAGKDTPSEVHVPSGGWHLRGNSDMIGKHRTTTPYIYENSVKLTRSSS